MTLLDDRHLVAWPTDQTHPRRDGRLQRRSVHRPAPARPSVAPLRYRGHGISVSASPHRARVQRTVSTPVTVALAGLAALATVWLGLLAQSGADRGMVPAASQERLAVVQVQAGETLQQLAGRVYPGSSVERVAERIRDLNELDSSALEAGQTLIAPLG